MDVALEEDEPRGRWEKPIVLAIVLIVLVLAIAWIPPIVQGWHLGYNSATDHYCETRLGLQWCGRDRQQ